MNKSSILILVAILALSGSAASISRWFSASFYDLKVAMRRYGHCVGDLPPLRDGGLSETDFLIGRMRAFLNEANLDNEQLNNVTLLMDNICRTSTWEGPAYPISISIDVNKYSNGTAGKENRCRAIDEALDSMFVVMRRSALNRSEPLDFSSIRFYPDVTNRESYYNLTDLINTSWIKSETSIDQVCKITDSVKEHVFAAIRRSSVQDRSQSPAGLVNTIFDLIDRLLEPLLGLSRRFSLESSSVFESGFMQLSNGLGSIRDNLNRGVSRARDRVTGLFVASRNVSSVASNVTSAAVRPQTVNRTATAV